MAHEPENREHLNRSIPAWQWLVVVAFVMLSLLALPQVRASAIVQQTWTAICAPFIGG